MVKKKPHKSTLSENQKKEGKQHVYILIGMIIIGLSIAFYHMHS